MPAAAREGRSDRGRPASGLRPAGRPVRACQQAVEARCRAHADQVAKRLARLLEIDKRTLEEQLEFHALDEYNEEASPSCSPANKAEAILNCVEPTPRYGDGVANGIQMKIGDAEVELTCAEDGG